MGADTWGLGAIPVTQGNMTFYEHVILLKQNGIYILETMNTGRLAKEGVTDDIHDGGQGNNLQGRHGIPRGHQRRKADALG